ncbi:MAG TPA: carbon-nitrogen hydrolase family protein [Nitrososphaeraceae archaeon]|nr:carbon-nitrogen hydrolase family protein [Nitrososphaeraceae archaeon]
MTHSNHSIVALVQMRSSENKEENLKASVDFISRAADRKASLICFPEFQMAFSPLKQSPKDLANNVAEYIDGGNFVSTLCRSAKKNKIGVIATVYERNKNKNEFKVYDTAVIINNKGQITSVYRKLHLYNALGFRESDKLIQGNVIEKPVSTSVGNIGLMICYDIRFPEMSRILTVNGADILVVPSAWVYGIMKEDHWRTMIMARAIENGSYIIAPDQVGNIFSGRSMVADPFGTVLLDMGDKQGMDVVEIDKSRVMKVRESLPLLKNRRLDIYRKNIQSLVK